MNGHFTKENMQIEKKHVKTFSKLAINQKLQ